MIGRIQSFQSLGTVDGPGVRNVIFLQGCPLRCVYCHNPETWDITSGYEYEACDIFEKILKYRPYTKNGGVTVTGGEPLLQIDFIIDLFKLLKNEGIHTAIDTSGFYYEKDRVKLDELLKYTDLIICDLKFTTEEEYKKYTGYSMCKVLEFLDIVNDSDTQVYIRQVVVPNINDTETNIIKLKEICNRYDNIEKIELLPFRKLCLEKYEQLNMEFKLKDTDEMSMYRLLELDEILKSDY